MKYQRGFTLVELSIVLVILGLLVGGVLTGQSLIRAAELRSVASEYNRYITAVYTFRDKYFALPGDMTNAQAYWGIADASPSTCVTTVSTDSKTCNGDGNGKINQNTASSNESFRFWQHLANAGLIEGNYTGTQDGIYTISATTKNVPRSKMNPGLWYTSDWGTVTGNNALFDGTYGNVMQFGGLNAPYDPGMSLLKAEEVYNIDMKVDDGKPASGKLWVEAMYGISNCTDTSTTSNTNANYRLDNPAISCALMFKQAF